MYRIAPVVTALVLGLVAPSVSAAPSKIAAPTTTSGGQAAEAPSATRGAPPTKLATQLRTVLARIGDDPDVTPTEQALLADVVAGVRAGNDAKADAAWAALITAHHARTKHVDVNAFVQYVLRAAYLDQLEDLRALMEAVAATNKANKAIRDHLPGVREAIAAHQGGGTIVVQTIVVASKAKPGAARVSAGKTRKFAKADLVRYVEALELELSQADHEKNMSVMQMQDLLSHDARKQAVASTILKKQSDTASGIVANLK